MNKVKPRDKNRVMEELKQICSPDQWDITPEKAFGVCQHDRYRFYFTYFKYEREIRVEGSNTL
ncbi:MAG: hypothetical protein V8R91_08055 [Butyricimonas faecihominis]